TLFASFFANEEENIRTMAILKGFAVLSIRQEDDGRYFYMHRLLQDIVRINVEKIQLTKAILTEAADLVGEGMNYDDDQVREILTKAKPLLPHAESLIEYLRRSEELSNEEKTALSFLYYRSAEVFYYLAEYDKSLEKHKEALSIRREVYGNRHPEVATSLSCIGVAYSGLGRKSEVLEKHEEALSIRREVYGNRHPDVAASLNNIGYVYYSLGRKSEALEKHEESLSIRREVYGNRHPDVAMSLNAIGLVYDSLGRKSEALEKHEESLSIRREVYGNRHPDVAMSLNNIGYVYNSLGRKSEALEKHEESLSIGREVYGNRHPDVAYSLNAIGVVYYSLDRKQEALEKLEEALSIRREFFSEDHPDVQRVLGNIKLVKQAISSARSCEVAGGGKSDIAVKNSDERKEKSKTVDNKNIAVKPKNENKDVGHNKVDSSKDSHKKAESSNAMPKESKDIPAKLKNDSSSKSNNKAVVSPEHRPSTNDSNSDSKTSKDKKCIISLLNDIIYDNELLNCKELVKEATKTGNIDVLNRLLEFGKDRAVASSLIEEVREVGAAKVVDSFFLPSVNEAENPTSTLLILGDIEQV
ncbi:MAG: tetratricopeptide repeat protein, partial [Rickettsiaceae bacterium]|nr:tetratricopeptide repeat protein [Rickettsiaceae bacterium]